MYNQTVVRQLARGDDDAFHIMFDDWAERVYAHAYDVLQDGALARSALRRTFSRIYAHRTELSDTRRFDEWLMEAASLTVSEAALKRRTLCERERDEEWELLSKELGISDETERPEDSEKEEEAEWRPIFFAPDEEDTTPRITTAPAAEQREPALPAPAEKQGESQKEPTKQPKKRRAKTVGAVAAGCVLALALVCGGVYFALTFIEKAGSNPALSGAIEALTGLLTV